MFKQVFDESIQISKDLNCDMSDDAILEKMILPPVQEWNSDLKLKLFISSYNALPTDQHREKLIVAIKNSRSAGKGSIRGKILENAVILLAKKHSCKVETNSRLPALSAESIDCVITLKNGEILYIMCQVDLWNGGQQTNRADKYLNQSRIFISVVYNEYQYDQAKEKKNNKANTVNEWITTAYKQKRLMWLADLDKYLRAANGK